MHSSKVLYAGNILGFEILPCFQEEHALHYFFNFEIVYKIERKHKKLWTLVSLAQAVKVKYYFPFTKLTLAAGFICI